MNIFGKHIVILNDEQHQLLHQALADAGHEAEVIVLNGAQQLEHALESSEVGVFIQSEINTLKDSTLNNVEKMEQVVAKAVPFAIQFLAGKGVQTTEDEVLSAVKATAQGVFNTLFSSAVPNLIAKVKDIFGIK